LTIFLKLDSCLGNVRIAAIVPEALFPHSSKGRQRFQPACNPAI
jgi:hypothetical protein